MSWILAIILHILPAPTPPADPPMVTHHLVQVKSSKLIIHGETNVNKFDCDLYKSSGIDQLNVTSKWSDFIIHFDGLTLKYEVSAFNCGHPIMNKDFCSILKSDEHPFLFLKINDIYIDKDHSKMEKLDVSSFVTISLAGVERAQMINEGTIINYANNELTFTGKETLNMTDFGIDPPTKFLGLVSVSNQLSVEFEIQLIVTPINE